MSVVISLLSGACLLVGTVFCVIGGIGLLRMPDLYTRAHAAGVTDTLGAGLVLVGLMMLGGFTLVTAKLALLLGLLYVTSPTVTHALVKAAHARGVRARLAAAGRDGDLKEAGDVD